MNISFNSTTKSQFRCGSLGKHLKISLATETLHCFHSWPPSTPVICGEGLASRGLKLRGYLIFNNLSVKTLYAQG